MNLRDRAGFRHLTRHPWQLLLSLLGVALGVAVMVAMDLAIQSSREAFRISSETVAGRATHQVLGGATGVSDSLPASFRIAGGVRAAAPVVEGFVASELLPDRPLRLLGVDPFSEPPFRPFLAGGPEGGVDGTLLLTRPGAVFLSEGTALALGVGEGDRLPVRLPAGERELEIAGILQVEDEWSRRGLRDLLVVDIAEAQTLLGMVGRLDRVDLILGDADIAAVEALLPPGARLVASGTREATMEEMIRAFDLNLTALSLLALVFGVFLIYNTMTFSVVQRRKLLGTLRALGATRGEILRGVLREAALLGAVGTALGLALGVVLGRGLVRLVTRTINDLYFVVSVEGLTVPPGVLLKGAVLGVGATLLASLLPAWEAAGISPREALARSSVEDRVRGLVPRAAAGGVLLCGAGVGLLLYPTSALVPAFTGLFALILGMALLTLPCTVFLASILRKPVRRAGGIVAAMAARGVVTSLSRTAPAIAALVIAVSVTVGLGIMIQSFRGSVVQWLEVTLQADLYVSPPSVVSSRAEGRLSSAVVEAAGALDGVEGVSLYRGVEFASDYGMIRLVALDLHPRGERAFDFLALLSGDPFPAFRAGEGVLVSEPFAFRHDVQVGMDVSLPGESGTITFPVLGIFRDYGAERGVVMMVRSAYDRLWTDPHVTSMAIFLQEGADEEVVSLAVERLAGAGAPVVVRSNRALRDLSLEVFDRTFAITRVLRLLAFMVAFIAVLSALMALQLERVRELGVLRANGMTPRQCWGLVTSQTALMGSISGLLAIPVGIVLAVVMIFVVNRRSFGWTLQMEVGSGMLLQALALALGGALLAGVYPSWKLSRTSPAEALRGES